MDNRSSVSPGARKTGHTIAVVAERTGLSRDVLRVWERRYQAVDPERTAGGQRLYSDAELTRFQLLAEATRLGRSIGSVAGLGTAELQELLNADLASRPREAPVAIATVPANASVESTVERALERTRELDSARLDAELRGAVARYGWPLMLERTIPALMHRIGDEWGAGRLGISHEHLASGVVLAMLLDAVRTVPEQAGAPRLLVATPAGEQHVIGAALLAAAAAIDGWSILFLGADVPATDLVHAARGARAIALSIVLAADDERVIGEVRTLRDALPAGVAIIVGGAASSRLSAELAAAGARVCHDIVEARRELAAVRD